MNRTTPFLLSIAILSTASFTLAQNQVPLSAPLSTNTVNGRYLLDTGDVLINPDLGRFSGFLNTDTSWQVIQVPLERLNGATLDQLSLNVSGLPSGLNISLARAAQQGNVLILNVDVNRSSSNAVPNGLANITLLSDNVALTSFQVPVQYVSELAQ